MSRNINLKQTVEWIPVEERLPMTSKNVLAAFSSGGVSPSRYSSNQGQFLSPMGERLPRSVTVTHWAEPLKHPNDLAAEKRPRDADDDIRIIDL